MASKALFHIILYQPEIPPNTGNIIRLCANIGAQLHLIEPLGFDLSHKQLQRAGLDYHIFTYVHTYPDLSNALAHIQPNRVFALSTKAKRCYAQTSFAAGDAFLFGPETRGLPITVLETLPCAQQLRIPMQAHNRSINLSNCVAIVVYEAWRQLGFL